MFACVFLRADFLGFVAGGGTSDVILFAQRAATILRAWALRSSGVSFAQRALPPSDWIVFKCSRTVRSFFSIFIYRRQGVSQIYRNQSLYIERINGRSWHTGTDYAVFLLSLAA